MEDKKIEEKIKKLEEERQTIRNRIPQLDEEKNLLLTRLIEIQGIINYLTNNEKEESK